MQQLLSPSYGHEKLDNPTLDDLIDIFEDCWTHYIFAPCELLLKSPHGDIAAITLLCSYFETIGGYLHDQDTTRRSKEFFCIGLSEVLPTAQAEAFKPGVAAIYTHVRCGVAHEGLLGHKVNYSRAGSKAFYVTYPKAPDGSLDTDAEPSSIVVNPLRLFCLTREHFQEYVRRLRKPENQTLRQAFRTVVTRQWNLEGTRENLIGMTEEEFHQRA
ncbi:hypothetical protein [Bordetella bronchiseptica]|uniref:hypothetical protein n=1 Tax=Bordetella bronchiseptica TaxID=518 RepID=UPI001300A5E1|nr:hypothetical protein [Bordetella bronchiseptica]